MHLTKLEKPFRVDLSGAEVKLEFMDNRVSRVIFWDEDTGKRYVLEAEGTYSKTMNLYLEVPCPKEPEKEAADDTEEPF